MAMPEPEEVEQAPAAAPAEEEEEFKPQQAPINNKRFYEHQSSFASFMTKKGDVVNRLIEEKDNYRFKSPQWLAKREKGKKLTAKQIKNLKQILMNDTAGEYQGSYNAIEAGISVKS